MLYISGFLNDNGIYNWMTDNDDPNVGVRIYLDLFTNRTYQRMEALIAVENHLKSSNIKWVTVGRKEWLIDLDAIKQLFTETLSMDWFKGKISIEPEIEFINESYEKQTGIAFYITPELIQSQSLTKFEIPVEISKSLERFKKNYPDSSKVAFIMMKFAKTKIHDEIVHSIKSVLSKFGIFGIRADEKEYHEDLFSNILTYIFGCSFGIAIFERIEAEEFNPNVSLEVGYMLALKKPICFLKDSTLKTLHTDLVGKLYKTFNTSSPEETIEIELEKWLLDRGII